MLKHGQVASGLDLGKTLMELVRPEEMDLEGITYKDRVVELCNCIIDFGEPLKLAFLKRAIRWSSPSGRGSKGYSKLHWQYARELWNHHSSDMTDDDDDRQSAKHHFALAMPDATFDTIEFIMKKVKEEEGDGSIDALEMLLYILKEKELGFARFFLDQFLHVYGINYGEGCILERWVFPIEFTVYSSSVLNGAQLLLLAIQRNTYTVYRKISEFLKPRIPTTLSSLLDEVGTVWFPSSVKTTTTSQGFPAMFSNILSNVLGGMEPSSTTAALPKPKPTLAKETMEDLD
jgi:hypothetical protein